MTFRTGLRIADLEGHMLMMRYTCDDRVKAKRPGDTLAGISREAYEWLKEQIGPRCRNIDLWHTDMDTTDWYYHSSHYSAQHKTWIYRIWFRTANQAMLFKLAWS